MTNSPVPDPNFPALLKLLSDESPEIVETARLKLIEMGEGAVPLLEEAARSHEDPKVRVEAKAVVERIRLAQVGSEWKELSAVPDEELDLERGVFLMAKVSYPGLDPESYRRRLDEMADQIRPNLKSASTLKEQLNLVNQFLFKNQGFRGNWNDYFNPENSYINRVLDRKLGIPVTLSVLYLLVCRRLKLPIQGAGIPGHFMVKCNDSKTELFVDAFNEGRFLSRPECVQFIVEAGYPYQPEFLTGIGPREILARILRNLILIYVDRQEETLERTMSRLLDTLYPGGGADEAMEGEPEEES
ncbi:MAG: hypothetical protein HYZ90_05550 [Candidatus Omnitrophica bacterium]|nr:hypothetical protein [Candidatus Omnitrophota bacterium]